MDREPFARIVENDGEVWVCVGQYIINQFANGEGLVFANNLLAQLNSDHEKAVDARVKEEVKEAEKAAISWAKYQCGCAKCVNPGF